jgi:hypothetical protein
MYSIRESDFEEAFNGLQKETRVTSSNASRKSSILNYYYDGELAKIEKARARREDLNSQDGNTGEYYDQVSERFPNI